jgi:four helix bundle protein
MKSVVSEKSYAFAAGVVNAYKILSSEKKEYVLSKQFLRSGTSIGAMVREAEHAQSKADFLNKMNIALKEANEVEYWLMLLCDTNYLSKEEFDSLNRDCEELIRLLASIVKTTKSTLQK